jgi:hypothetical protein
VRERRAAQHVGQRDAERVVDLGDAGEGWVETLAVHLADDREADLTRRSPVKLTAGELAFGVVTDMDRERRGRGVEELFGMVVGEDDPQIGVQHPQPGADLGRRSLDALDRAVVVGFRHRE